MSRLLTIRLAGSGTRHSEFRITGARTAKTPTRPDPDTRIPRAHRLSTPQRHPRRSTTWRTSTADVTSARSTMRRCDSSTSGTARSGPSATSHRDRQRIRRRDWLAGYLSHGWLLQLARHLSRFRLGRRAGRGLCPGGPSRHHRTPIPDVLRRDLKQIVESISSDPLGLDSQSGNELDRGLNRRCWFGRKVEPSPAIQSAGGQQTALRVTTHPFV